MRRLLRRMFRVAGGGCRLREGDDGVTVLTRVERELCTTELAVLPAEIERMVEDVPTHTGLVDAVDQFHLAPSGGTTPRRRCYARRLIPATARLSAASSKR